MFNWQVLEMIANYYGRTSKEKKRIINFCSQYPGIGLLNVAVSSLFSFVHLSLNIANMYLYSLYGTMFSKQPFTCISSLISVRGPKFGCFHLDWLSNLT